MKKIYLLLLVLGCSCQKRTMDSASMFTKGGDLKDKVALYQVIDSSASVKPWDVQEEFTLALEKELSRKDTLYIVPVKNEVTLSAKKNPFGTDISWMNQEFSTAQYIVFTELVKYEAPEKETTESSLDLSLRVRVFKKSNAGFRPILQEIVQESYTVPSFLHKTRMPQPNWQMHGYELSPIGIAHEAFISIVAKRIRDYIKTSS